MGIAERKEREKQQRRKSILTAAEKIFFGRNGDKGTMDDIAEKVELSKGTLYLYFKNKTDLLYAIAEKGVDILINYFDEAVNPELKGRGQLSDLGDAFARFVEEHAQYFELILRFEVTEPQSGELKKDGALLMEPALAVLKRIISTGQDDGSIRNDLSVDEIVIVLWSQMLGLMQSILRKDRYIKFYKVDLKRIIKGHYRIVMKGVAPQ